MLTFKTDLNTSRLIIGLRWIYLFGYLSLKVIALFITFFVFMLPYDSLVQFHEYAYFIYFLPLLPALLVIKGVLTFFYYFKYSFVKNEDAIYRNKKLIAQLSSIKILELYYKGDHERTVTFIRLVTVENQRITIFKSFGNSHSLTKIGISIAKFLNIEFINTHPHYDRIIWGGVNASEKDISFLENRM